MHGDDRQTPSPGQAVRQVPEASREAKDGEGRGNCPGQRARPEERYRRHPEEPFQPSHRPIRQPKRRRPSEPENGQAQGEVVDQQLAAPSPAGRHKRWQRHGQPRRKQDWRQPVTPERGPGRGEGHVWLVDQRPGDLSQGQADADEAAPRQQHPQPLGHRQQHPPERPRHGGNSHGEQHDPTGERT